METAKMDSPADEEDDCTEVTCLKRVGRGSDWLRLYEKTEITMGRTLDVTYPLLSLYLPLMISRLHCTLKQTENGEWTVTDNKSLNGVYVNGKRIPAEKPHQLRLGDSIQMGVPLNGNHVEFDYVLVRQPLKAVKHFLRSSLKCLPKSAYVPKKPKRKLAVEEVEPSTSEPKLYRCSSSDKSFAKPCPRSPANPQQRLSHSQLEGTGTSGRVQEAAQPSDGSNSQCDMDNLQTYSQNNLKMRELVVDAQKQAAALGEFPHATNSHQVMVLQGQLMSLRAKMHRMEELQKSFSEAKAQLEAQKTQQEEELMKKQLDEALQEQKKVMDELALSRHTFEEILSAKNRELEVTKEEKERARAQKDEVVTQVTEVLENELQCIICSELFIEAIILNCAHSFCSHCIKQWREKKDDCPICRRPILSQTRCLALDNCIDSMVGNLSLDMKARREALIRERKAADSAAQVMVIHDDSSSSGSGGGGSSSDSDSSDSDSSDISQRSVYTDNSQRSVYMDISQRSVYEDLDHSSNSSDDD